MLPLPAALLLLYYSFTLLLLYLLYYLCLELVFDRSLDLLRKLVLACEQQRRDIVEVRFDLSIRQRTSAYVSIRQHTSAYVSIRQHTSAYVSTRQHTSAYVIVEVRFDVRSSSIKAYN